MFILDPGSEFFPSRIRIYSFPDPASKSISILTQFGFFIPGPDPDFLPILDTGFKKASVADPDPGLGAFLTPGSGIRDGRKSASGSGIRDEQPGSYFLELRNHFFAFFGVKILKFFDEDPGSGMETVRIRDLGWRQFGSGMEKSRIRDKHPGSATLKRDFSL
jgi:hypothetical protein